MFVFVTTDTFVYEKIEILKNKMKKINNIFNAL